jgi:hypothetical protein
MRKDALKVGDEVALWTGYSRPRLSSPLGVKRDLPHMVGVEIMDLHFPMDVPASRYSRLTVSVKGILVKLLNEDDANRVRRDTDYTIKESHIELRTGNRIVMLWSEWLDLSAEARAEKEAEEREEQAQREARAKNVEIFNTFFGVDIRDDIDEFAISDDDMEKITDRLPIGIDFDTLDEFAVNDHHTIVVENHARAVLRALLGVQQHEDDQAA